MTAEKTVQEAGTGSETRAGLREQLAQHLAQQSESRRTFDKFMKVLEVAGLALIAGHLAWAIYVSINWSETGNIVAVWMSLPVTVAFLMVLAGVHGAGIRAFFPVIVPGSSFPFVTGSKAVGMGLGAVLVALVAGAFWGAFAWGIWAEDWSILEPLTRVMAVVVGAGVMIALLSELYRRLVRSR